MIATTLRSIKESRMSMEPQKAIMSCLKRFIIIFLPLFLVYSAVLFYIYHLESSSYLKNLADKERALIRTGLQLINDTVEPIRKDLGFLIDVCQDQLVYSLTNVENFELTERLLSTFQLFAQSHPEYDQVRFLDKTGQERVRINNVNDRVVVVDEEKLQNKAGRYYFQDTMKLGENEIYISPLDLNVENHAIEIPLKPMMRLGRVIFSSTGQKLGVVILNYKAQKILDKIKDWDTTQPGDLMLLNRDGFWLYAKNSGWNWGFMYYERRKYCFATIHPELWKTAVNNREQGQIKSAEGIHTFTTVYPLSTPYVSSTGPLDLMGKSERLLKGEEYYWKLVSEVPSEALSLAQTDLFRKFLLLLGAGLVLTAGLSAFLTRVLIKKKQAERALYAANDQLEKSVEARTRELSERNLQLQEEIDRRLKTERRLATNEERYSTIMEAMEDEVYVVSGDYELVYVNPNLKRRLPELTGSCYQTLYNRSTPCPWCVLQKVVSGETVAFEMLSPLNDKTYHISNTPIKYEKDKIGKLTITRDITEARQTKKELLSTEKRLMTLMDAMREGLVVIDPDGTVSHCSQRFAQMLGYQDDELIGSHFSTFQNIKDAKITKKQLLVRSSGQVKPYEVGMQTKTGERRLMALSPGIVYNDKGNYEGSFALVTDITEQRAAEEKRALLESQLQQAQKMEALGTLAGGIAHDFNNVLAAILGYTEIVKQEIEAGSPLACDLDQILVAGQRASALVKQILAFSRQTTHTLAPLSITPIVKEALKLLRAAVSATVAIDLSVKEGVGKIMADPAQIHQIIMNLCTNSCHALEGEGGRLQLSISPADAEGNEANSGDFVMLTVEDNGCGIPEEKLDKIFDPFFTTKEIGKGTGLGLAVVHSIVEELQGTITVVSRQGEGTTFKILLPVTTDSGGTETIQEGAVDLKLGAGEHIIWVDDEEALVALGCHMLEKLNYHAHGFTRAGDCLEAISMQPDKYNLVISDYNMPKVNGLQLIRYIRDINEAMPVIICSGYSERVSEKNAEELSLDSFLMKPVDRKQLAETIHEVLHRRRPAP